MTPGLTVNLLRALFVILCGFIGSALGEAVFASYLEGIVAGLLFGLAMVLADRLLHGVTLRIFSAATFGLLLGLICAQLLLASGVLRYQSAEMQWLVGLGVYLCFGYIGTMLAIRSNREEFAIIIPFVRFRQTGNHTAPVLIDSNICIDGRVIRLCQTGFVSSSIIVPRFVLAELQLLADSSDPARRERGRRGLDCLNVLRDSESLNFTIHESELNPNETVDNRLVQLAQLLGVSLLTNDINLGKIARLQHVMVLHLHELDLALRSSVNTGDALQLALVKEGREPDQAVGYMPDGTMIVVNRARAQLGKSVPITVSSVVQTAAGRLVFADLR